MKGVIQGTLWGLVLGVSGLSFASLVTEQPNYAEGPAAPQITAPALEPVAPGPVVALQTADDTAPDLSAATPLESAKDISDVPPQVSTTPAQLPQTADVTAAINSPPVTPLPGMAPVEDAPDTSRAETLLQAPATQSAAPRVDTQPAIVPEEQAVAEVAPRDDEAVNVPQGGAAVDPTPQPVTEAEAVTGQAPPETTGAEADTQTVVSAGNEMADFAREEDAEPAPSGDAVGDPTDLANNDTAVAPAPVADEPRQDAEITEDAPSASDVETTPSGDAASVAVTEVLPQTDSGVRINRPVSAEPADDEAGATPEAAETIPDDAPALLRYAVPFDAGAAASQVAIILVDDGQMDNAAQAVAELPFIPTVAIDALQADAVQSAAAYRAAGAEIAMQAQLPDGARPADVEVAFEAAFGMMPDVAMLFSDGTGAIQDRAVTAQVMQILAADGYGFVTVQRGLSNAARAAEQAGVAGATILRDIDGGGETVQNITLALNQAAFRARQSGQAVLLGRVQPDTLDALQIWAKDLDQSTLAIVPVSGILLEAQ